MGPLVATGGVLVPAENARALETAITAICQSHGLPEGEIFKWSPSRGSWFHDNLVGDAREEFFRQVLAAAEAGSVRVIVVVSDTTARVAVKAVKTHEMAVTAMFLERVHNYLRDSRSEGLVINDRPSGGRQDEDKFLDSCLTMVQMGTDYVKPNTINYVLAAPSRTARLLQLADLVTSCTLATVAGEGRYAPRVFRYILPLFRRNQGRIGGCGLKIHPDYRYVNLYHWILGDPDFIRFGIGVPLPLAHRAYASGPDLP